MIYYTSEIYGRVFSKHPDERRELAENAKKRILKDYTYDKLVEDVVEGVSGLLGRMSG